MYLNVTLYVHCLSCCGLIFYFLLATAVSHNVFSWCARGHKNVVRLFKQKAFTELLVAKQELLTNIPKWLKWIQYQCCLLKHSQQFGFMNCRFWERSSWAQGHASFWPLCFCNAEGVIMLRHYAMWSNYPYIQTHDTLQKHFRSVQPHTNVDESSFNMTVHNHTQVWTHRKQNLRWTDLPHPLYSPDHAPSDLEP
jgi:hypothetical protein